MGAFAAGSQAAGPASTAGGLAKKTPFDCGAAAREETFASRLKPAVCVLHISVLQSAALRSGKPGQSLLRKGSCGFLTGSPCLSFPISVLILAKSL